ncbi:MAG TPA: YdeI/OmpD-associated family protein [Cyclobacteriaceae bacterium]|nr:YdeI/OmpD-associated family protein [Cyclobacteriaceae bacterium]
MMKPLVDKSYLLERFPGKGGWTFARIPEVIQDKNKPFGWVKVKGSIDGYEIRKVHLMPMGNGKLFLPVKAEIRKKIKKKEGDHVHVILFPDDEPLAVPEEMLLCLEDEPKALSFFHTLSESEQLFYIKWIYSAKKEDTKINRLARTVNRLMRGLKLYDKG